MEGTKKGGGTSQRGVGGGNSRRQKGKGLQLETLAVAVAGRLDERPRPPVPVFEESHAAVAFRPRKKIRSPERYSSNPISPSSNSCSSIPAPTSPSAPSPTFVSRRPIFPFACETSSPTKETPILHLFHSNQQQQQQKMISFAQNQSTQMLTSTTPPSLLPRDQQQLQQQRYSEQLLRYWSEALNLSPRGHMMMMNRLAAQEGRGRSPNSLYTLLRPQCFPTLPRRRSSTEGSGNGTGESGSQKSVCRGTEPGFGSAPSTLPRTPHSPTTEKHTSSVARTPASTSPIYFLARAATTAEKERARTVPPVPLPPRLPPRKASTAARYPSTPMTSRPAACSPTRWYLRFLLTWTAHRGTIAIPLRRAAASCGGCY
ncbi:hypothetical protein HPP92_014532 [Vanilla planifolia]|uniref:Uncharacterized protein n=1 Tax=Vanilla planifolia TaxID=51239 RepID=A0A835UU59_VANPL|nr:hypothetical protein HPP92_014532 [Vanilla planifolia]